MEGGAADVIFEGQERKVKMKVEYLSPDELREYPGNAKIHTPEQVKRIAASIKAFGWQQPIVIDKDGTVIIGHGRLYAARELMLDSVPVVRADDLTEDQVKALRLADNQTAQGDYDFAKLEEELAALDIAGFDMEQFGFSESDHGGYVDDFFDRGVEAKDKPVEYILKCNCGTEEALQQAMQILQDAGFAPEEA